MINNEQLKIKFNYPEYEEIEKIIENEILKIKNKLELEDNFKYQIIR